MTAPEIAAKVIAWWSQADKSQSLVLSLESPLTGVPGSLMVSERSVDDPSKEPVLVWRGQTYLDPDTYTPYSMVVVGVGDRLFAGNYCAEAHQDLRAVHGIYADIKIEVLEEFQ